MCFNFHWHTDFSVSDVILWVLNLRVVIQYILLVATGYALFFDCLRCMLVVRCVVTCFTYCLGLLNAVWILCCVVACEFALVLLDLIVIWLLRWFGFSDCLFEGFGC